MSEDGKMPKIVEEYDQVPHDEAYLKALEKSAEQRYTEKDEDYTKILQNDGRHPPPIQAHASFGHRYRSYKHQ